MTSTKQDTAPSANSSLFRAAREKINKVDRATVPLLRRMETQVFCGTTGQLLQTAAQDISICLLTSKDCNEIQAYVPKEQLCISRLYIMKDENVPLF